VGCYSGAASGCQASREIPPFVANSTAILNRCDGLISRPRTRETCQTENPVASASDVTVWRFAFIQARIGAFFFSMHKP
jgi:hypothetical protein